MVIPKALRKAHFLQKTEEVPRISLNRAESTLINQDVVALKEAKLLGLDLEWPEAFAFSHGQRSREQWWPCGSWRFV